MLACTTMQEHIAMVAIVGFIPLVVLIISSIGLAVECISYIKNKCATAYNNYTETFPEPPKNFKAQETKKVVEAAEAERRKQNRTIPEI